MSHSCLDPHTNSVRYPHETRGTNLLTPLLGRWSSGNARRSGGSDRGPGGSQHRADRASEKSSGRRDPNSRWAAAGGREWAHPSLRGDGSLSFPAEGATGPRTSGPTTNRLPGSALAPLPSSVGQQPCLPTRTSLGQPVGRGPALADSFATVLVSQRRAGRKND